MGQRSERHLIQLIESLLSRAGIHFEVKEGVIPPIRLRNRVKRGDPWSLLYNIAMDPLINELARMDISWMMLVCLF